MQAGSRRRSPGDCHRLGVLKPAAPPARCWASMALMHCSMSDLSVFSFSTCLHFSRAASTSEPSPFRTLTSSWCCRRAIMRCWRTRSISWGLSAVSCRLFNAQQLLTARIRHPGRSYQAGLLDAASNSNAETQREKEPSQPVRIQTGGVNSGYSIWPLMQSGQRHALTDVRGRRPA